ncbi:hypothetical protein ACM66B_001358 [Microbotryomycetes sp. NB124-2]
MSTSNKRPLPSPPPTSPEQARKVPRTEPVADSQTINQVSTLTWQPMLGQNKTCLVAQTRHFQLKRKVALFDFVPTVIGLQGGSSVPSESYTFNEGVVDKMRELQQKGYCIVLYACFVCIYSEEKMNQQRDLFNVIALELSRQGVDLQIFGACKRDEWWKPSPCVWYHLQTCCAAERIEINMSDSFYCGSAAGRTYKDRMSAPKPDWNDYDRCFALNVGLEFITPQDLFQGGDMEHTWALKQWNPAEWRHDRPFFEPTSTPLVYRQVRNEFSMDKPILDVTIAVGPPACGKTFLFEKFFKQAGYVRVTSDATQRHAPLWTALSSAKLQHVYIDMLLPTTSSRQILIKTIQTLADSLPTRVQFKLQFRLLVFTAPWQVLKHNSIYKCLSSQVEKLEGGMKAGGETEQTPSVVSINTFSDWFKEYQEPKVHVEDVVEIKQVNFTFLESRSEQSTRFPRGRQLWLKYLDVYGSTSLDKQAPVSGGHAMDPRTATSTSSFMSKF